MKIKKIKDIKFRKLYSRYEIFKRVYKFLFVNFSFSEVLVLKKAAFLCKTKLYKEKFIKNSRVKFNNRCILTNRSRGVAKRYGVSRIKLREFLQYGILPGFSKAVW